LKETDMKLPVLVTALALACGGAYAQSGSGDGAAAGPNTNDRTTMSVSEPKSSGDSVAKKMKRGVHKFADATRRTGQKIASGVRKATHKDDSAHASKDETRSMGASPSEDSARRARMDSAYENFKRKQQK
jgi:hypothetical protein